jgi:endonuclease-3
LKSPQTTRRVIEALAGLYPGADTELHYRNAFELLVATMLSAQSTDARVNLVTPALFARYPDARALAKATPAELEPQILSTGFFRQKSKALVTMAQILVRDHRGQVPADMDTLTTLPGVGRKTANVVLNVAFGEPTMAVDTHVFRVANRTGLAPGSSAEAVEQGLMAAVPDPYRTEAHHWLILHGRYVCTARSPDCRACAIHSVCAAFAASGGAPTLQLQ